MKAKRKFLGIIIPTYGRASMINEYVKHIISQIIRYDVDLILYDSSDDEYTRKVFDKWKGSASGHLLYERYEKSVDHKSMDEKVISAYKIFADDYEYIWICRDGLIINLDAFIALWKMNVREAPDFLVVDFEERNKLSLENMVYTDPALLFHDVIHNMVTLGVVVVRSEWILHVITEYDISKYTYSLWNVMAIFHFCAAHAFIAQTLWGDVFTYNPIQAPTAFWNARGNALWQWGERWCQMIDALPVVYTPYKTEALKLATSDFTPFSYYFLIRMKASNSLKPSDVRRHKSYIARVSAVSYFRILLLALLPIPRSILKKIMYQKDSYLSKAVLIPFYKFRAIWRKHNAV